MADFFSSKKFVRFTENTIHKLLGGFADSLNDGPSFINASDYDSRYFYSGSDKFRKNPTKNACWMLGYAIADLTPYDFKERDYYLGGYLTPDNGFNNKIQTIVDKMQCRIIALDDNSGNGTSFFATIDCIGTGNSDIKLIRRRFADLMKYAHPEAKIASVNVFSTHAHSCVDTQGLWTDTLSKVLHNKKKNKKGKGTYLSGADSEFMYALATKVADGLLRAYEDMTTGTMSLAQKDIGDNYFNNKNRKSATSLVTKLTRLVFTPDDSTKTPTIIATMGAHPDVAGLPTSDGEGTGRDLCGEYIYYMGETVNKAGYNFMFFNGAICAIYMSCGASNDGVTFNHRYERSIRFGRELGRITLALTKTLDEIMSVPVLYDKNEIEKDTKDAERNNEKYTLWCENWEPVKETAVKPLLNIRIKEVHLSVTNPLIQIVGKLNLASYKVLREPDGTYTIVSEIGFLQIGKDLNIVLVPGEFCADLLTGGDSLKAEGAYNNVDFPYPPLTEIFNKDLIAFGLANDAIGYIVPDNDYVLGEFNNHYHELIGIGKHAGSTIIKAFMEMKAELGV
ncbi:MAG: hypothetical protein IKL10_10660 [Clostridia bacterium]|nr:hypothetical protein [Clostridia bacterium]